MKKLLLILLCLPLVYSCQKEDCEPDNVTPVVQETPTSLDENLFGLWRNTVNIDFQLKHIAFYSDGICTQYDFLGVVRSSERWYAVDGYLHVDIDSETVIRSYNISQNAAGETTLIVDNWSEFVKQ